MKKVGKLEEWLKNNTQKTTAGCGTCKSPYKEKLDELLDAMIKLKAHNIPAFKIREKLKESGYNLSLVSLQKHLHRCVRAKWDLAKGRA